MAYKRYLNYLGTQDGKVWNESNNWKWNNTNGDNNIAVGENQIYRVQIDIPKNSFIRYASFETEFRVKNENTVPQSFTANVSIELDAAPYPATSEVYLGAWGTWPIPPRRRVNASVNFTANYTVVTSETADFIQVPVGSILQEVVNHPDYEPGQHIAITVAPSAENGDINLMTRDQTFASQQPTLKTDYIEPNAITETPRYDVNLIGNGTFDISTENWGSHAAYGAYVDSVTLARTNERSRRGNYSMKVSPNSTDASKGFMAYTNVAASRGKSYVFTGWVYVPSTNPLDFRPHFLYDGATAVAITAKDQWVPFCTNPITVGVNDDTIWPAVSSAGASNPAYSFFVDDLAVVESKYAQYPFDESSPNHRKMEYKSYYSTPGFPAVVRKGNAHVNARVQPFIVLDDWDTTANWSITSGAGFGITMDTFNGGVRFNLPAGDYGYNVQYNLPAGHFRRKRYLVVNSQHDTSVAPSLGTVLNSDGAEMAFSPAVQATEAAGAGTRRFYDIPQGLGRVSTLVFSFTGTAAGTRSVIFYDLGESDRTTAQSNMVTSTGWVLKNGMWLRTTTERQSVTFDDTESTSGHAQAGKTLGELAAMNKKFNDLEAL